MRPRGLAVGWCRALRETQHKRCLGVALGFVKNSTQLLLLDGNVIAIFGVGHMRNRPQDGRIWMLGSDELFRQGRVLLRDGPIWVREMMKGHTVLGNFVDARNEPYIQWLKRLGFRFVSRATQEAGMSWDGSGRENARPGPGSATGHAGRRTCAQ